MFFAVASACRTSGGSWVAAIATPRTTSAAPRTIHMRYLPPAGIQRDGIAAPPSRVNPRRRSRATPGSAELGSGSCYASARDDPETLPQDRSCPEDQEDHHIARTAPPDSRTGVRGIGGRGGGAGTGRDRGGRRTGGGGGDR